MKFRPSVFKHGALNSYCRIRRCLILGGGEIFATGSNPTSLAMWAASHY